MPSPKKMYSMVMGAMAVPVVFVVIFVLLDIEVEGPKISSVVVIAGVSVVAVVVPFLKHSNPTSPVAFSNVLLPPLLKIKLHP